jgi:hypothetical protein
MLEPGGDELMDVTFSRSGHRFFTPGKINRQFGRRPTL